MRRREFIALLGGAAAAWSVAARAQQSDRVRRIGFLANDPTIPTTSAGQAFMEGLHDSGFIEGKNIVIERRFAEGKSDLYAGLAADLVRLDPDVIVASSTLAVMAASQATKKIPIVILNVSDPVRLGIVGSLAHPEGNITGLSNQVSYEIAGKRLALLKECVPQLFQVVVLINPDWIPDEVQWKALESTAQSLGIRLQRVAVRRRDEFEGAFAQISRERADGLFAMSNPLTLTYRRLIIDFAANNRLPAVYPYTELAADGGLMSYGASRPDLFRRAAIYVAKILRGVKPADLPIEQPTKFELVINLKTAKALGLTVPPTLLARADEVIE